jgi:hypothetical protein
MPTLTEAITTYLKVDRAASTNHNYQFILRPMAAAIGPLRDLALVTYADLVDYVGGVSATMVAVRLLAACSVED